MGSREATTGLKVQRLYQVARCARFAFVRMAAVTVLAAVAGCGNDHVAVSGRVAFEDGSPLDEGIVVCETTIGKQVIMARGNLDRNGRFRLGVQKPGDGVVPGKYHVLVVPRALTQAEASKMPPIIDPKYEKFETSGLEFEFKQNTELTITVTKAKDFKPTKDERSEIDRQDGVDR